MILALDVIEHVEEDKESFHALYHSLKKSGFLVFTVPAYSFLWSSHDTMHHHKRRYTKKTLTNIIDPNQYSIEYLSYFQFFLFPLLCVDRMIFDKLSFLKSKNQNHSKKDPKEEIPSFLINRLFQMIFSFESRFIVSDVNYLCRSASIIFAGFSFPFFHSFVVVGDSFHLLI